MDTRPAATPARLMATAVLGLCCTGAGADAMPIHHILPPAELTPDGVPDLDFSRRTAQWATQAGLELRWVSVPIKRSIEELRRNHTAFCVLGLFDLPERRRFARYSLPISNGEAPVLLVARRVAAQMRLLPDARSALLDPRFEMLAFDGAAYGETLDRWAAERQRPPLRVNAGTAQAVPMLNRGRADFMITVDAEWHQMLAKGGEDVAGLEIVRLPGMPEPPRRHLACSQRVPADWLARFNAAVRRNPPPPAQ